MRWRNDKVRPDEATFAKLCCTHTRKQIADLYGVTTVCVHQWTKHYGIKPISKRTQRAIEKTKRRKDPFGGHATPGRLNYLAQPNACGKPRNLG